MDFELSWAGLVGGVCTSIGVGIAVMWVAGVRAFGRTFLYEGWGFLLPLVFLMQAVLFLTLGWVAFRVAGSRG